VYINIVAIDTMRACFSAVQL